MFLWLKFTTITPSFYFKNRLFIERGFRVNNMYTYLGSTQKSFTWLPTSSSNLSLYWFRRRSVKWLFFSFFVLLVVFFLFDFSHFTPLENTQVVRAFFYVFWRAVDCIFFFTVHFFIFFFAALTWGFRYLTNFASTEYWTSVVRTKHTTPRTSAPQDQLNDLRIANQSSRLYNLAGPLLTSSDNTFTRSSTVGLVSDLYRLLLATAPVLELPGAATTTSVRKLPLNVLPAPKLSSTTTHSCFFLQTILPQSVSLSSRSLCSQNLDSLAGSYGDFLSPDSVNFGYARQATDIRTVRWVFRSVSSAARDTSYVRNLLGCSSGRKLLVPFLDQTSNPDSTTTPLSLEWFGFRSTYLARPFLVASFATNTQTDQQSTFSTMPFLCQTNAITNFRYGLFLWDCWSDLFTNGDYLVLNLKSAAGLGAMSFCSQTTRRWL